MKRLVCAVALGLFLGLTIPVAADETPPLKIEEARKVSFRRDVWPIFKRHCWGCHTASNAKGGLNMDSVKTMLKGGESGPLFEMGKPDESLLIEMTVGATPEMPQKQAPLSKAKIHLLRSWVFAGAKDDSIGQKSELKVNVPAKYRFAPSVSSVALSRDGKHLAAACRSEVVLLDPTGKSPARRLPTDCDLITYVEFSPDGKILAASGGSPARYGQVQFFQVADGKLLAKRRISHDTLFRGGFSPDGKLLAVGGADGAIHVVPLDARGKPRRFELHSDWILDVAFSPDGKLLISAGRDKSAKVASVETGKLLRSLDSSPQLMTSVAVNSKFAVASGRAKTLTGYELKIALSDVGVTGAGNGAKPVTKRNQYVKRFETQPGEVLDMASTSDGKLIAVAGDYGEIRVYSIDDRKRIAAIVKLPAPVYSISLDGSGKILAVGTKAGQVHLYQVGDGKLLKTIQPVPVESTPAP